MPSLAYRARAIRVPCTQPTSNRSRECTVPRITYEMATTADANHNEAFKIHPAAGGRAREDRSSVAGSVDDWVWVKVARGTGGIGSTSRPSSSRHGGGRVNLLLCDNDHRCRDGLPSLSPEGGELDVSV